MAWQETIEALKNSGETEASLRDLYVRASKGDPSVLRDTVRLHDKNRSCMPMGAETIRDKFDDIMYALGKYFEDEEKQCEEKAGKSMRQPECALALADVAKSLGKSESKSSVVADIAQLAQQPEGRALIGDFAQALGGIFKGKKNEGLKTKTEASQTTTEAAGITWQCSCGYDENTRNFCEECGAPKPLPEPKEKMWKCSCGYAENTRNFCAECGKPKPKDESWVCAECGTENTRKFCPNCGNPRP